MDDISQQRAKKQKAIELLLEGQSDADVAKAAKVDRSTIWRWRSEPSFAAELDQHRHARRECLLARLDAAGDRALHVLVESLDSDNEALRVKAALEVLDRLGVGNRTEQVLAEVERKAAEFVDMLRARLPKDIIDQIVEVVHERPAPN